MIRIALCDDEPAFKNTIERLLLDFSIKYNEDYTFEYFSTSRELLSAPFDYDVLYLDIRLEENCDGIYIGKQLREMGNTSIFVLVTSLKDRYREGYQAGVLRYIEKPVDSEEFEESLTSALKLLRTSVKNVEVKFKTKSFLVKIDDIIYIESYNRKRCIYTNTAQYPTKETLESFFERLPTGQFYYPQKCYLINFAHVASTSRTELTMSNGKNIAFIKGKYQDFNDAFMKYLGGNEFG